MEVVFKADKNIVIHFLEDLRTQIVNLQISKNLKASGRSAEMLRIDQDGNTFSLIDGAGYFEQQEKGKKPGATPFQVIYEWLKLKKYGIDYKNDKQRERIAYAILANHRKYGSYIYRRKRVTGVLSEVINNAILDRIMGDLAGAASTEILSDVLDVFRKLDFKKAA